MQYLEKEDISLQEEENPGSLTGVFLANFKSIHHYVASYFCSDQDADDILQDVFVKIAERGNTEDIESPKAFMYKVARNLSLNKRSRASHRLTDQIEDADLDHINSSISLDELVEQEQRFEHFCEIVDRLPPQCQRVFKLKKIDGLSNGEIATKLNITVSTVDKHLAKGLIECKNELQKLGHLDIAEQPPVRHTHLQNPRHSYDTKIKK
ncbi:RNA polymerase sigma factor [Teredinibacter haidensis]|uniref:RNA polymerase sigma factor n=1 Tax=Teredinibacter haidensis TaxID=2731755 RepID=UPI000948B4CC|nr:sigma-70 family RNA polymerase sigma factor [Teredinibacter haidensis]